jgi:sulfite exporter TauE/SafE
MSSTEPLYILFFSTGVAIGFGHCIGMCGPIVVALTLSLQERSNFVPLLLYNTGRIITYGILGGVMGVVGSFTVVAAHIEGAQKVVMVAAGVLIVVMGLVLTGWIPFLRRFRVCCETPVVPSSVYQRIFRSKSDLVFLPLGLLLGLLPCGPVYTSLVMVARASMEVDAGMGVGFLYGMILMLLFGVGTAPALLVVGGLANTDWVRRKVLIERIAAFLMIAIGIYFTYKGLRF